MSTPFDQYSHCITVSRLTKKQIWLNPIETDQHYDFNSQEDATRGDLFDFPNTKLQKEDHMNWVI